MSKYFAFAAIDDEDAAQLEKSYQEWCQLELNAPQIDDHWLCRVCLETGNEMDNIFANDEHDGLKSLAEQINQCSMEIPLITRNDGFPQYICGACKKILKVVMEFRELCKQSDDEMRAMEHRNFSATKPDADSDSLKADTIGEEMRTMELQQQFVADNEPDETTEYLDDPDDKDEVEYLEDIEEDSVVDTIEHSHLSPQLIDREVIADKSPKTHPSDSNGQDKTKPNPHAIHQCEICDWVFKTAFNLKRHMKKHLPNLPFACQICNRSYRLESGLRWHMMAAHNDEYSFCCETCGKTFKTSAASYNHRLSHDKLTKFPCRDCPHRAASKANLIIHQRIHSGLRPYECRVCFRTFTTSSNRLKHFRCVHEKRKEFGCTQCDRQFSIMPELKRHMMVHIGGTPHSCPLCPRLYRYRKSLLAHLKIHHAHKKTAKINDN